MNDEIIGRKIKIEPGTADYYADQFIRCEFVLGDGETRFFNCIFTDCTFDPPIVAPSGEGINPLWFDEHLFGCVINL